MDATRPPLWTLVGLGLALGALLTGALLVAATQTGTGTGAGTDAGLAAGVDAGVATVAATPSTAATSARRHAFWGTTADGSPLRWDPCSPVDLVLRDAGAPPGAEEDLRAALALLADASGLDLRLLGTTDERPRADRPLVVREGDGWRWAPVLVAWDEPGVGGLPLGAQDRGVAVPIAVRSGDREALVTGQVVLNRRRTDLRPGFGDRADSWGATLTHELAHILGLAHVEDPTQLMSADPGRGPVVLGPGDRAGLALIGRDAGCRDAPTPMRGLTPRVASG